MIVLICLPSDCSDMPDWKTCLEGCLHVFFFIILGRQNLISQVVFLVRGEFPLRLFLFIVGIVPQATRFLKITFIVEVFTKKDDCSTPTLIL